MNSKMRVLVFLFFVFVSFSFLIYYEYADIVKQDVMQEKNIDVSNENNVVNNQSNSYGYWLNSYYLVPQRAITLTLNYNRSQKMVADTITVFSESLYSKGIFDPITNIYAEIYIEFVNGFKGKIAFKKNDDEWLGQLYKHYDFF